jgi:hypothetical protein
VIDGEVKINDIWIASVIAYAGSELVRVTLLDEKMTEWVFLAESEDVRIMTEDYFAGNLALSDARSFVFAFNRLAQQQKEMRRSGVTLWEAPRSDAYRAMVKESGEKITAMREAFERRR